MWVRRVLTGSNFVGSSHRLRASDSPNEARTALVIASIEEACVMGRKVPSILTL
jgi:hypothetical protein